jgi:glycosyltransferase involved in cell wall biosynthesis
MKILLAHNYYQSTAPSGEDSVFLMERELLESSGHEVVLYERHNDEIGTAMATRVATALATTWSRTSFREVSRLIETHRPDVAHFHNTFPLISPSAYRACQIHGVPVVQTLHNYRLICPGALLMRDGLPCEQCVGTSFAPAIKHACYRDSRGATSIVAGMLALNRLRGSYRYDVDCYLSLTQFARDRYIRGGLPHDRIAVRGNFLSNAPSVGDGTGQFALYVGRLTPEKGVATLVRAWQGINLTLKVVGDGSLRNALEKQAMESGARIEFVGLRPRSEVWSLMQKARFVIIPSECYEGFPITALEAFATGAPLIVAAIGALNEVIPGPAHGLKFKAGDADSLHATAASLIAAPEMLDSMRIANRTLFENHYTREHALRSLENIYSHVKESRQFKGNPRHTRMAAQSTPTQEASS